MIHISEDFSSLFYSVLIPTLSIFSPLPIFRWKTEFSSIPFNRIPHKTDYSYLRSGHRYNKRLLILYRVGLLLISDKQNLIAMYGTQEKAKRITDIHVLWGQSTVIEELIQAGKIDEEYIYPCLLYTSPSPRDA